MVDSLFRQSKRIAGSDITAYRLVNSRYPTVDLFDDVVDADDFEVMFELQALTNPRILDAIGDISLLPKDQRPSGIDGFNYAVAPFTHINPQGSRFSDGRFGVLYLGQTIETAVAEVKHHQDMTWRKIPSLHNDQMQFRGLSCQFNDAGALNIQPYTSHGVYDPSSYALSRPFGEQVYLAQEPGIRYNSVRQSGATCWAMMTPKPVSRIVQTAHYEMTWEGSITSVKQIIWP